MTSTEQNQFHWFFHFLQWVRSIFFIVQMYFVMATMALCFVPMSMVANKWVYIAIRTYCRYVRWSAHCMIGLRSEVIGEIPSGEVLICAKHQSFFDILILCSVLPKPRFVMKRELSKTPIVSFFARKIDCISVDRGKKGVAIAQLKKGVRNTTASKQLVIYPQGTRVAPGVKKPYKIGAGVIYSIIGLPCIPTATNVGLFWPRRAIFRKSGKAIVEFLPKIDPGLPSEEFLKKVEQIIEENSKRLCTQS